MDTLRYKMPTDQGFTFQDIFDIAPKITAIAGIFGLAWRWIDKHFESKSQAQRQMLIELIEEKNRIRDAVVAIQFDQLTKALDRLTEKIQDFEK
mgnify:CR=1 FL=1